MLPGWHEYRTHKQCALGDGNEVGESVHLFQHTALVVPGFAHISAAANVCDSKNHPAIQQAEAAAAQDILQEGLRYVPQAETLSREGRPEREIIQCASEWNADLIVICSRSPAFGGPALGPKSVGHVARFVLDHAPCPVLLVRPPMSDKAFLSPDTRF